MIRFKRILLQDAERAAKTLTASWTAAQISKNIQSADAAVLSIFIDKPSTGGVSLEHLQRRLPCRLHGDEQSS